MINDLALVRTLLAAPGLALPLAGPLSRASTIPGAPRSQPTASYAWYW